MADRSGGTIAIRLAVRDGEKARAALRTLGAEGDATIRKLNNVQMQPPRGLMAVNDAMKTLRTQADGYVSRITSIQGAARGLAAPLTTLGAALGAREIGQMADSYTRLTNAIKIAGVEAENHSRVEDNLFSSANRTGTAVEALGTLFSRTAQASKELGASQGQMLTLTDAAANAIKIQGTTTEAASGALLQLSQALGSPIVRAEEFNSVLEGMRPLAQAAANGISRMGGSVAKLREEIASGNVTSQEFFHGILSQAPQLAEQAAKANLTLAGSFQAVVNELTRSIGQTDKALGVTERLSQGMLFFAQNLDKVGIALGVIAASFGVRYTAGLVKAGGEQVKFITAVLRGRDALEDAAVKAAALEVEASRTSVTAAQQRIFVLKQEQAQYQANLALAQRQRIEAAQALAAAKASSAAGFGRIAGMSQAQAAGLGIQAFQAERAIKEQLSKTNASLLAQETVLISSSARVTAAETAKAAALHRTTLMARAAVAATSVAGGVSAMLGGPVGIAITTVAAGYLLYSNRVAKAEEQTKAFKQELRSLGLLAEEAADSTEKIGDSLEKMSRKAAVEALKIANEEIRKLKNSQTDGIAGVISELTLVRDNAEVDARLPRYAGEAAEAKREVARLSEEVIGLAKAMQDGTRPAEEIRRRLQELSNVKIDVKVNGLISELLRALPVLDAALTRKRQLENVADDTYIGDEGKRALAKMNLDNKIAGGQAIIAERDRRMNLSDRDRRVEDRTAEILKSVEKDNKVILTEAQAKAQAIKEVDKEIANSKSTVSAAAKEERDYASTLRDGARVKLELGDITGVLAEEEKRLSDLVKAGVLSEEERQRALAKTKQELLENVEAEKLRGSSMQSLDALAKDLSNMPKQFDEAASQFVGNFADSILDIADGSVKASEGMKMMAQDVVRLVAQMVIAKNVAAPLAESLSAMGKGMFGGGKEGGGGGWLGKVGGFIGSIIPNANGGIVSSAGAMPLNRYATGGVAYTPQLALYGEGRTPEAYVPLPDGRSIPVSMRGGGAPNVTVNVHPAPNTRAEVQQRPNAQGGIDLDVIVRQVEDLMSDRMVRGESALDQTMSSKYGLQQRFSR